MKRVISLALFIALPFVSMATTESTLADKINSIIKTSGKNVTVGMTIQSMKSDKVLFEHHPDRMLVPASVLKIFTGATSLSYLGPDYKFETVLLANKRLTKRHTLHGNLTIRFSGDPSLRSSDIDTLFLKLKNKRVTKITGNINVDASQFGKEVYGPGWKSEDMPYCYSAPISSMNINSNCIQGHVRPGYKVGQTAKFVSYDAHISASIHVKTVSPKKNDCLLHIKANQHNRFNFQGCIPLKSGKRHFDLAIKNPFAYTQKVLRAALKKNGITLKGHIVLKKTEPKQIVIAKHLSKPLISLTYKMLKESDNTIADNLLKTLGHQASQHPGTWKNGVEAMKQHLHQHAHINFDKAVIVDGSGLSRNNLISPKQVSQLLNFTYHQFSLAPEFIANLPIGGIDGTLSDRLDKLRYQVRAKTGSMNGINGLAGYVNTKTNGILSFVILINGKPDDMNSYQSLVDKIVEGIAAA